MQFICNAVKQSLDRRVIPHTQRQREAPTGSIVAIQCLCQFQWQDFSRSIPNQNKIKIPDVTEAIYCQNLTGQSKNPTFYKLVT